MSNCSCCGKEIDSAHLICNACHCILQAETKSELEALLIENEPMLLPELDDEIPDEVRDYSRKLDDAKKERFAFELDEEEENF